MAGVNRLSGNCTGDCQATAQGGGSDSIYNIIGSGVNIVMNRTSYNLIRIMLNYDFQQTVWNEDYTNIGPVASLNYEKINSPHINSPHISSLNTYGPALLFVPAGGASLDGDYVDSSSALGETGFSSGDGDEAMRKAVWVRGYNSIADQGSRTDSAGNTLDGYDSLTKGGAFGIDGMVTDKSRAGISFNLSKTTVTGDGFSDVVDIPLSESDITSYQVAAYGDYTSDMIGSTSVRPYYLVGMLAYGVSDVKNVRMTGANTLTVDARSEYDAHQVTTRIGGGVPLVKGRHVFTPNVALQHTHVWNEDYTETGATTLNLVVQPEDIDIGLAIVGLDYMSSYAVNGGVLTPQIRTSVSYDFISDEADSVSRFISDTATFSSLGAEVDELAGSVGAGLMYSTPSGKWDLSADYDADLKNDYIAHTSRFEVRLNF